MGELKMRIRCRDCGDEWTIEPQSPIIPIVDGSSCLSDGKESTAKRCRCGCEAFRVIQIMR